MGSVSVSHFNLHSVIGRSGRLLGGMAEIAFHVKAILS